MSDDLLKLSLLTDDATATDSLGRSSVIETLTTLLQQIEAPACLAVYGSWGMGKTSVLMGAKEACEARGLTTVWFDPWEHERHSDALPSLILEIAKSRSDDATKTFKLLTTALAQSLASIRLAVKIPVLGAEISFDRSLSEILENARKTKAYHDNVSSIKADFSAFVREIVGEKPEGKLVVFLDDLDRCLPSTTVEIIEAVKLLLCSRTGSVGLTPVVFVFALDRLIVGEAIRSLYGGASTYTGENYLEKIFDFSLELPLVSRERATSFTGSLNAALGPFSAPLLNAISSVPALANPRVIKRAINRFRLLLATSVATPLVAECRQSSAHAHLVSLWIVGSERFRSFRAFFREAPSKELALFHQMALGSSPGDGLSNEGKEIAGAPGFSSYYRALTLNATLVDAFHKELRAIDDGLREIGL